MAKYLKFLIIGLALSCCSGCNRASVMDFIFIIPDDYRGWVVVELVNDVNYRCEKETILGLNIPQSGKLKLSASDFPSTYSPRYYLKSKNNILRGIDHYPDIGIYGTRRSTINKHDRRSKYYMFYIGLKVNFEKSKPPI